jgi:hypothetical protein
MLTKLTGLTRYRMPIVSRNNCQTCVLLEEYYRLKVVEYAQASTAPRWSPPTRTTISDDLLKARNVTLRAGHALLQHWLTCEHRKRKYAA